MARFMYSRCQIDVINDVDHYTRLARGIYRALDRPYCRYLSQLRAAERAAEDARAGMWCVCDRAVTVTSLDREQDSDPCSDECVIMGNISEDYTKDYCVHESTTNK